MNSLAAIRVSRKKLFCAPYFELFSETLLLNEGSKKCNFHYSAEEQQKLLKKINESSSDDLQRFSITSKRLEHLQKSRKEVGGFSTVDQLLSVCGLGDKSIKKFLDSILYDRKEEQIMSKIQNFITPHIAESQRMRLQNVVGIHVLGNSITWAKINKDGLLSDWIVDELDLSWKKRHPTNLLEEAYGIVQKLPAADVYVMEDNGNSAQHLKNNIISALQSHQLCAMLLTLLNSSKGNDSTNVFFLRHHLSARLFQTLVGNERISCQTIVQKLLDGVHPDGQEYLKIKVDPGLQNLYYSSGNVEKEIMCHSLLLSITFMELVILGRSQSIAAITSRKQV